ncbi:hypothetical protein BO99DRAFT_401774 [Aspergillus violaceofuscus CBS 115571]|uniref:Uncharacterized protein n=1 Tax=Aspergillus violaceofuscus (strain CBS 115571) TaxID=1450538 RepID=A0A2V5H8I9_ASPV1|nr:hypothetical protein BO99DRAFT_401774 [Aspergillus violaceofuscus CBS 115571]
MQHGAQTFQIDHCVKHLAFYDAPWLSLGLLGASTISVLYLRRDDMKIPLQF